jgi:uncharacterized protein (TIGR03067 family)
MTPLFVGLALIAAAPAPKPDSKKDPPTPIGVWSVESALKGGRKDTSPPGSTMELTAEGKMVLHENGKDISGTYKTDPKKDPAELDLTLDAGGAMVTMQGIYRIEGETMMVCLTFMGDRPKTFDSPDQAPQVLLTLKRVKKD